MVVVTVSCVIVVMVLTMPVGLGDFGAVGVGDRGVHQFWHRQKWDQRQNWDDRNVLCEQNRKTGFAARAFHQAFFVERLQHDGRR